MQLDSSQVQIFVSLVLVLGALFVALICDFLKGNNEKLRELGIELAVRQEREQGPYSVAAPAARSGPPSAAASPGATVSAPMEPAKWARPGELERIERMAETIRSQVQVSVAEKPAPAAAEPLPRPAHGAPPAASNGEGITEPTAPVTPGAPEKAADGPGKTVTEGTELREAGEPASQVFAGAPLRESAEKPGRPPRPVLESRPKPVPRPVSKVTRIDRVTLDLLGITLPQPSVPPEENREAVPPVPPSPDPATPDLDPQPESKEIGEAAVLDGPASPEPPASSQTPVMSEQPSNEQAVAPDEPSLLALPAGLHEGAMLTKLLESPEPFGGMVLAIGVTVGPDREGKTPVTGDALTNVVASVLSERDAAFVTEEDEFIVVLPDLGGTQGQRRLQQISEILWDFQIRSMGTMSVVFSVGSAEVRHELLGQAVSSARDRMYHTKKTRERAPSEIHHYRRNGMRG